MTAALRNPGEPNRSRDGLFLVDAGATDCLVVRPHLGANGLMPEGKRAYRLVGRPMDKS